MYLLWGVKMKIYCIPSGSLGANTYIVYDEESKKGFILDPGGYNDKTKDLITNEEIELEYIILTHGHGDHIGGVPEYKNIYQSARVLACKEELSLMQNTSINFSLECIGRELALQPDVLVEDGDCIDIGNMHLKFIHTPGHTKGGMCILIDNVLFSGDTLFRRSIGRTDFPGGSFEEIAKSIKEKLYILPDDVVVLPGHMGQTTIGEEKKGNPFVCLR